VSANRKWMPEPDTGLDDVVSQLREACELPRHAAGRGAAERRLVAAA
jgi:hypothetical protein